MHGILASSKKEAIQIALISDLKLIFSHTKRISKGNSIYYFSILN